MFRRISGLLIVMALAVPARAQEQQYGWAHNLLIVDGKPATEHDFGTVAKGAMLQHRIPVINKYGLPLSIQLGVSCDCVKVTANKAVLQPKETTSLDIEMDTRR